MKIEIKYSGGILNLPSRVADLAPQATENELKVILSIFSYSSFFSDFDKILPSLAEKLDMSINGVIKALSFWARNGVLLVDGLEQSSDAYSIDTAKTNTYTAYTGAQISAFIEKNSEIKELFDASQAVLGKTFNTQDFNSIIYLKSYFKFSDDFILVLLAHCVESDKASWAYIKKLAQNLYEEGVDTYEKLEKHFAGRRNKRSREYKIRKIFGIGEREFTSREKATFDGWISSKISVDLIKRAYEITIEKTGKPSLAYTSKILENWQNSGIKTIEEVESSLLEHQKKLSMSSFDTNDFFDDALKRSEERINKRRKE